MSWSFLPNAPDKDYCAAQRRSARTPEAAQDALRNCRSDLVLLNSAMRAVGAGSIYAGRGNSYPDHHCERWPRGHRRVGPIILQSSTELAWGAAGAQSSDFSAAGRGSELFDPRRI